MLSTGPTIFNQESLSHTKDTKFLLDQNKIGYHR